MISLILQRKTDFETKLKDLNIKVASNKTKNVLVENELSEQSKKVEAMSTKKITNDWTNKCMILNRIKYFSSGILQNYLVIISANKYFTFWQWHN